MLKAVGKEGHVLTPLRPIARATIKHVHRVPPAGNAGQGGGGDVSVRRWERWERGRVSRSGAQTDLSSPGFKDARRQDVFKVIGFCLGSRPRAGQTSVGPGLQ